MKKYKYDLHTHSCLSPCGDDDMTPNNMVNMASLLGCEILAISDHNTCKNAPALCEIGKELGILVVPAMELCTVEECHILCLFKSLEHAMNFDEFVNKKIPNVKNKEKIFGKQQILDKNDNIIGIEEKLLITSADINAYEITEILQDFHGIAVPAHVDKSSYSLMSSLGTIPPEYGFNTIELSKNCDFEKYISNHNELSNMKILKNSDAHYLEDIAFNMSDIALENLTLDCLIDTIKYGKF